jgi:uncharacterized protein with PIN domain
LRFWDSSAIVPLTVAEASTEALLATAAQDPVMCVWWATEIECVSALSRLEREGALTAGAITTALDRLDRLAEGWNEVQPTATLRGTARRHRLGGSAGVAERRHSRRTACGRGTPGGLSGGGDRPPEMSSAYLPDGIWT